MVITGHILFGWGHMLGQRFCPPGAQKWPFSARVWEVAATETGLWEPEVPKHDPPSAYRVFDGGGWGQGFMNSKEGKSSSSSLVPMPQNLIG